MLRGRRGLASTMIGRAAPLESLVNLVDDARRNASNEPAIALVSGEAGIGKTRLLTELGRRVGDDVAVLAGQAEPASLGQPYGVVASMIGDLGDVALDATSTVADVSDQLLSRLTGRTAVVIFEDLHWADTGSVAVLARLVTVSRPGLVLVASYRPDDITQRLPGGELLARLERSRNLTRIHLEPLRRVEVGAFLAEAYGRPVSSSVVDAMLVRTGGNPFFLEEIVHAAGSIEPDQLATSPLPWSLADLVSQQLDGLSHGERQVADASAVLGNRGPFDVLMAMTETSESELIDRLRALVRQGLLVEEGDDDFSFRHALVRDAVLHQLLSRERRRLHSAALAALQTCECRDIADLARHAAGAQLWDEMVALAREGVPYYLARGSSHQALRLATNALDEQPDDLALLAGAARAAWLLGLTGESLDHASRWLELATQRGLREEETGARRMVTRLYLERHDERLWSELAELERLAGEMEPGVEQARVIAAIAQTYMLRDRTEQAVSWGDRAIEAAELAGAKDVLAQAKVELGTALYLDLDRAEEGERLLREAIDEAEVLGDWVLVSRGLNNLGNYMRVDDDETVDATQARHETASNRAGFVMRGCGMHSIEIAFDRADAPTAQRHIDQLAVTGAMIGAGAFAHDSHEPYLAKLEAERGSVDRAIDLYRNAPSSPAVHDATNVWSKLMNADLAAFAGDPAPALALIAEQAADPSLLWLYRYPNSLHLAAEAALRAGATAAQLDASIDPLRANTHEWIVAAVAPVEAELAVLVGDHERVVALLEPLAGPGAPRQGEALARARMRYLLAMSLAALGRKADAVAIAEGAANDLARWPGFRADEVQRLLARLTATPAGAGTLSAREVEVAAEVAKGHSNAELARELFISPKTAAVHVSNILTKLGLANRTEIAAWYLRNQPGAQP